MRRLSQNNFHSKLVAWLKILLPLTALAVLSTLFMVSRNVNPGDAIPYADVKIANRLRDPRLTNASYAGMTQDGAAITLKAAEATPGNPGTPDGGAAQGIAGRVDTPDGIRTDVSSATGRLNQQDHTAHLSGGVTVKSSAGYTMATDSLTLALDRTHLESGGPVSAELPFGHLDAGRMVLTRAPDGRYVVDFTGGVQLLYQPAQAASPAPATPSSTPAPAAP